MSVPMVFYGLSLNTSNLNGNIYLNCFISAAIDITAYVACWLLASRVPRPTLLFCTMMFCGITLLVMQLVPEGLYHKTLRLCGLYNALCNANICFCLFVWCFLRHASHFSSTGLAGKDGCGWRLLLPLCIFHWAVSHCGQEHGLQHYLNSITHSHLCVSIHSLFW